jgi:hypothetical protein
LPDRTRVKLYRVLGSAARPNVLHFYVKKLFNINNKILILTQNSHEKFMA